MLAYRKYAEPEETQCFRKSHAGIYFLLISLRDRQSGSDNQFCVQSQASRHQRISPKKGQLEKPTDSAGELGYVVESQTVDFTVISGWTQGLRGLFSYMATVYTQVGLGLLCYQPVHHDVEELGLSASHLDTVTSCYLVAPS